jgi:phosphohistidine phosphatase
MRHSPAAAAAAAAALAILAGLSATSADAAHAGPSTLFLWRHADAEGGGAGADDSRALTAKGLRHAARGAAWLLRRLEGADGGGGGASSAVRVIASPARRAQQTAKALADALAAAAEDGAIDVRAAAGLAAGARDILDLAGWLELAPRANSSSPRAAWRRREWAGAPFAAAAPVRARTTVLVGHAPALGRAAALALTGSERAEWLAIEKGGVAWLEADAHGKVTLRALIGPKEMKAAER